MGLLKKSNKQVVLTQYLMTYFIVLFIPLIICCSYYIRMISVISEDDIRKKETELKQAAVLIDTMQDEFTYLGDSLTLNKEINNFKGSTSGFLYPNSYRIIELRNMLPDLYQINQSIFDYYIFFDKSEMVINKKIAYKYEDFYNLYLREQKHDNYEDWYSFIKKEKPIYGLSPMETYVYQNKEIKNMLVYTRPLLNYGNSDNSTIKILVEDTVLETLMPTLSKNSIQYIEDFQNNRLYGRTEKEDVDLDKVSSLVDAAMTKGSTLENKIIWINNEKYLAVKYMSDESGLTYYTLQPQFVVNNRTVSTVIMLTFLILIAVVVGIALSIYMSLKSATPINDILKEVSHVTERYKGHQSVFSSLKNSFSYLVNTNSNLAKAIESQKPYIKNAFYNRLIYGNFVSEEEVTKIASHLGIEYQNRVFCVVIIRFCLDADHLLDKDLKIMNSCIISLLEVINEILPNSMYTNLGNNQVVLMISTPVSNKDNIKKETEQKLLQIKKAMPTNISEKMFAYGGNEVYTLTNLYESYNNAAFMFRNEKGQIENPVIWYVNRAGNIPDYPHADLSIKLTHYVTSGDNERLHEALREVMNKYIIQNNLPIYLTTMLLNELQIVLFRIIGRIGLEEEDYRRYYKELEENHDIALISQVTKTLNLFKSVCRFVSDQKESQDSATIIESIVPYIDMNYADNNLSLKSVADIFNISEPYLSCVFKQVLGINFSTYVEGVRIDKAKELLKTTDMTVSEIAEHVGYYSVNSFCRAFKRVTGISASEYRRN